MKRAAIGPWLSASSAALVARHQAETAAADDAALALKIEALARRNREIHEERCFNLNPATNIPNPRAEALLAAGLGSRPSLGHPGEKYETGLEAVEEIETIAAELACEVFDADFAELRTASGAMANLYGFLATCRPGDAIIAPPAAIGGHVTHHEAGCAGLFGLHVHEAPIDPARHSVDLDGLRALAKAARPTLITIGGSLNLFPHPVAEIAAIAREVGAKVLFDAAHQCGIIAGRAWPNPLDQGADLLTMSAYKSLGGPASGLILTRDRDLAEKLDQIAFPGMTANFDAAKTAALAMTLIDWRACGEAYAQAMIDLARALAQALDRCGVPIHAKESGFTRSHQFAVLAAHHGGGQAAARTLRQAGFLACGIGLPSAQNDADPIEGACPASASARPNSRASASIATGSTRSPNWSRPRSRATTRARSRPRPRRCGRAIARCVFSRAEEEDQPWPTHG